MNLSNSPFARKLSAFVSLSEPEMTVLSNLSRRRRTFASGVDLMREGQTEQVAYVLAEGWVVCYKLLRDGTRQIVDVRIPGDFLGLRSILFRTADHNIEPITKVKATEFITGDLLNAFSRTPRLAIGFLWAASRDEAMVVEHLVSLGRRNAVERTAHFFLELGSRLKLVGLGSWEGYACHLSQYILADVLGLSAVHVNRVLRELREEGLMTFQHRRVTFHDVRRLAELAHFDSAYMDDTGPMLN